LSTDPHPRSLSGRYSFKLAGTTGRRVSQGGFLNRVFGSSAHAKKEKDSDSASHTPRTSTENSSLETTPGTTSASTDSSSASTSPKGGLGLTPGSKSEELSTPGNDKKRRSSSAKAAAFLNNAKNTLMGGDREGQLTPMQKLGKADAALIVPQGSLNNSAGESHQTPNSSFTVGITEDKNKKCRRTMEDTHSYLYNFLGTPAPVLPSDVSLLSKPTGEGKETMVDGATGSPQQPVETDNGYFAIFDGHAGTFAAEWCGKKLHVILEDLMRKNPNTPVPELLDQTFTSADQQLEKLPLKNSGCTAITAVLRWEDRVPNSQSATGSTAIAPAAASVVKQSDPDHADKPSQAAAGRPSMEKASQAVHKIQETASRQRVLYTANVGDARIVLCRNGKALRLSYDHKGSDENEGRRISNAGGLILNNRVNGVLAVTRALGDSYLKDLVTGHPYTTETVIQPDVDEFLILACDGVSHQSRIDKSAY
jgi:protein phosphatase PTC1